MKLRKIILLNLFFFLASQNVFAGKIDLLTGPFNLQAKVNNQQGSVSTLGAYKFSYYLDVTPQLQLGAGYTVMMSNTVGGDLAYGIDVGINYFPFTPGGPVSSNTLNSQLNVNPLWRPFVGGSFHQRQAQSTESSYAGFGVTVGTERALDYFFDLKAMLRYVILSGPNGATANETTVFIGASMPFHLSGK
ncbi:MAG: hypothetical protein KDD58_08895 [Bdellovibrionales bacterium]|nr:hypothetical protein [Bdellovibrionales bacterium]